MLYTYIAITCMTSGQTERREASRVSLHHHGPITEFTFTLNSNRRHEPIGAPIEEKTWEKQGVMVTFESRERAL